MGKRKEIWFWFCYSISPNSSMHCSSTNKFFAFYISFSFFKLCCFSPPWAPGISVGRRLVDTETTPIFTEERQKEANDAVDLHFDRSPPRSVASLIVHGTMEAPVAGRRQSPSAAKLPSTDGFDCGFGGDFLWVWWGDFFCGFDGESGDLLEFGEFLSWNLQFWWRRLRENNNNK